MTLADILIAFTSICGGALTLFLLTQQWKLMGDARREFRALPPEVRRKSIRMFVATWVGMAAAAGLIFAAYEWGAHTRNSTTGAVLAIVTFVILMACALTALVVGAHREERNPHEQGPSSHTPVRKDA